MSETAAGFWGSYAMATLVDVDLGQAVIEYLHRIDATLQPFGGRFLVHGGQGEQVEGEPFGDVVFIGFPAPGDAGRWYRSPAYQEILPLRTAHSTGQVVLLSGVDAHHRAVDVL